MYGHGAPPPARSAATVISLRVLVAAVGVLTCGVFACVPLFRVALLRGGAEPERSRQAVTTGFVVGVTNPKTIVFFVAFLPQFVAPGSPAAPQVALLGLVFGVMCVVSDSVWALAAGAARRWFARRPERLDRLSVAGGTMMIGLGAGMATQQ